MTSSVRAFILLAITAALLGIGGWAGHTVTDNAWQAKQAKAERAQAERFKAEAARGDQAATTYLNEHRDQEDRYAQLEDSYKSFRERSGLYSAPRVAPRVAAAGGADAAGASPEADAQGCVVIPLVADPPPFNLGAIWMWNSALAGRDVPAGACGAAAAASGTEAACAESSGLDANDAWDNHEANAKSCAEDRVRYRHLIEFLKGKKTNVQQ